MRRLLRLPSRANQHRTISVFGAIQGGIFMKNQWKDAFSVVLSIVVLVCCAALILGRQVSAAGEGKISGTVKLDGTAPHMKGINMSKEPDCVKGHANDPAHLETYVVGANGGLENVVLYISD